MGLSTGKCDDYCSLNLRPSSTVRLGRYKNANVASKVHALSTFPGALQKYAINLISHSHGLATLQGP